MRFIGLTAAVMLILTMGTSALAATALDPNDTHGSLDISLVHAHGSPHGTGRFRIETYHGFGCRYLKESKPNRLKLLFDDGRDGTVDLVGRFFCTRAGTQNRWVLLLHGSQTGSHYEPLHVTRPDRNSVKVRVPLGLAEFSARHMGVFAKSKDATALACTSHACRDRAPDHGNLKVY